MTNFNTTPSVTESTPKEDEIDLRQVGGALLRHKRLIGAVAGSALVLSTLYAFTRKPVWEGQFQIVLQNNQQPSSVAAKLAQSNPGEVCSCRGQSSIFRCGI